LKWIVTTQVEAVSGAVNVVVGSLVGLNVPPPERLHDTSPPGIPHGVSSTASPTPIVVLSRFGGVVATHWESIRTTYNVEVAKQFVLRVERAMTVQLPQLVPAMIELPLACGPPGSLGETSQLTDPQVLVSVKLVVPLMHTAFHASAIWTLTTVKLLVTEMVPPPMRAPVQGSTFL
jgi:hypothetical protein